MVCGWNDGSHKGQMMFATKHVRAFSLVEVVIVLAIIVVLGGLALTAVQKVRSASSRLRCADNLRQIGLAVQQYHASHSIFPTGVAHPRLRAGIRRRLYGPDRDPYPLLSWLGRLLPYIEQEGLWSQTVQAYATDPHAIDNPPHLGTRTPIPLYICPADGQRARPGLSLQLSPATTSYLGVSGTNQNQVDGVFYMDSAIRLGDIRDGTSHTLLAGERPPDWNLRFGHWYCGWGNWWNATVYLGVRDFDSRSMRDNCPRGPYHFQSGQMANPCSVNHFWSLHPGGGNFLFADGSVRFLSYSADAILPALATRAGGETVEIP